MIFPLKNKTDSFLKIRAAKFAVDRWYDKDKDGIKDRDELRLHAGCDLYCKEGVSVLSMMPGKIIMINDFYAYTKYVAIKSGQLTWRYGEIDPSILIKIGQDVKEGERIGMVKRCTGVAQAMLHLELFVDYDKGMLTDLNDPPFYRHRSLADPTDYLKKLLEG